HTWYERFDLPREHERGLDAREDHLHAGTLRASLAPGGALTVVLSAEVSPSLDGSQARRQRERHETEVRRSWRRRQPAARPSPAALPTTPRPTRPSGTSRRFAPITRRPVTTGFCERSFRTSRTSCAVTGRGRVTGSRWTPATACSRRESPGSS